MVTDALPGVGATSPRLRKSAMETRRRSEFLDRYGSLVWLLIAMACLLILILQQTALWAERSAIGKIRERGGYALALYESSLHGVLKAYRVIPELMSGEQTLIRFLQRPEDSQLLKAANALVVRFNTISGASDTYLMDARGLTLAASNHKALLTFVGQNFAFRPYFKDALAGNPGLYVALGTTSAKRGFYLSFPVRLNGEVIGVTVVKVGLDELEAAWGSPDTRVLVTDHSGVVFFSNEPAWQFRTLQELGPEARAELRRSRKYGDEPLRPLDIESLQIHQGNAMGVSIPGAGDGAVEQYLMQSRPITDTRWTLHVLQNTRAIGQQVLTAVLMAAFVLTSLSLGGLFLLQRSAYERRVRGALQDGRARLERRVAERTADLMTSNLKLRREIGVRKRAEDEVRQTQNELIQASKLAALGQIAAGITHELNQPLAAIRAYTENAIVLLRRERYQELSENLGLVSELTDQASSIISHLKVFARKTDDEIEPVQVSQVVEHTLALLAARLRKDDVRVNNQVNDASMIVCGNAIRLEQVLVNLLTNACDALKQRPDRVIDIEAHADPDQVILTISDNGPGMSDEVLARVFDPFFTTKEVGAGLGLGLSISYGIVQKFGGNLKASNGAEGGAEFTLELPVEGCGRVAQSIESTPDDLPPSAAPDGT